MAGKSARRVAVSIAASIIDARALDACPREKFDMRSVSVGASDKFLRIALRPGAAWDVCYVLGALFMRVTEFACAGSPVVPPAGTDIGQYYCLEARCDYVFDFSKLEE